MSDPRAGAPEPAAGRAAPAPAGPLSRALARCRREPLLALLVLLGVTCTLLPIWIGRYLPLLDYPNHLSMVFVWFHLRDPAWSFSSFYTISLPPLPYWAHYGVVYALSFAVGPERAQKLFLSATVLLFPLALAVYARRVGRDPRLALLAFPLAWSYATANGFLSYVAGIPMLLLALAALDHHAEQPSLARCAIASAAGASLYFFHVLPWALFLVAGGLCSLLAARPPSPARLLLAPLPTLPAAALGILAYRAARTAQTPFNPWNPHGLSGFSGVHNDIATNLGAIPGSLINFHGGNRDELALLVIALGWLVVAAIPAPGDAGAAVADARSWRGWRVEVCALVTLAAFLYLPRSLLKPFYWYGVNGRLVVVLALFLALLPRGPMRGPRRAILFIAAAAGFFYCADLAAHFHRFNLRARGFDVVMADVPRGKRVLPIMLRLSDPDVAVNAYNQWGSYIQMRQGGYMQWNFVSDFPVRTVRRLASPPWDHPERFDFAHHGGDWDYFVVRGPSAIDPFAGHGDRVRKVRESGDWALWEKLPPRAD